MAPASLITPTITVRRQSVVVSPSDCFRPELAPSGAPPVAFNRWDSPMQPSPRNGTIESRRVARSMPWRNHLRSANHLLVLLAHGFLLSVLSGACIAAGAHTSLYVATNGEDSDPGTIEKP